MLADLITPRAVRWLQESGSARVLHAFPGVCNLVNARGVVLSFVAPRIGPGPFALVLAHEFAAQIDSHLPVSLDPARRRLAVGPLAVDYGRARLWEPAPDWPRLRHAAGAAWPPPAELPPALDTGLWQTLDGIARGDWPACQIGVVALAGRGAGLTPAGDDVLTGVLFALHVWGLPEEWARRISAMAATRTTTLSANFLRAAAAGEATWPWHELAAGRPRAVDHILAVGHTSGADAWAGFVRACRVLDGRVGNVVQRAAG